MGDLASEGRLLAGRIGKPHGLDGEVYVIAISDDPTRFSPGSVLTQASGEPLAVERSRAHRNRLLVKFRGVEDRTAAERIRGPLFVDASHLRALEAGQYWEHELVGLLAVDTSGVSLGRVVEVEPGADQDRIVLQTAAGERQIPLVDELVRDVDPEQGRIVLDPPEGLLD